MSGNRPACLVPLARAYQPGPTWSHPLDRWFWCLQLQVFVQDSASGHACTQPLDRDDV